jgi:hypothetical protein
MSRVTAERYATGARIGTEGVAESAREGARILSETTVGLLGTATGAAGATLGATEGATAGAMRPAAGTPTLPIAGYDEMNVEEISERLNDLSAEQIRLLRDYEERNKKRNTLLEQMDRKIRAT